MGLGVTGVALRHGIKGVGRVWGEGQSQNDRYILIALQSVFFKF